MSSIYDRLRAQQAASRATRPEVVVAPVPVPVPTQAAAQPSIYDRPCAEERRGQRLRHAARAGFATRERPRHGRAHGKFVGRTLADPNNSPQARARPLGFDATTRRQIQEDPVDALVEATSRAMTRRHGVPAGGS